jgi:hypothetical protein
MGNGDRPGEQRLRTGKPHSEVWTVLLHLRKEASRMNEGSLVYWAPNDKRTLRNIGSTPTSYQVIRVTSAKSPKPIAN